MSVKVPPHANAEAHRRFLERMRTTTANEIAKTAEKVGIYDRDGRLTPAFGGASAPSSATNSKR